MAGTKKINKSQARQTSSASTNAYDVIAGIDGNPKSPTEHDANPAYHDELFFKADENATDEVKKVILILNFIHQELHQATERKVPVLHEGDDNENLEVYHRTTYQDAQLDVCVYWPRVARDGDKRCLAIVKFTSDNLPEDLTDGHLAVGVVHANAGWNAEAKADEFTFKNQKLGRNYWAPRWKYVVNALRSMAFERYEKNGDKKDEPETAEAFDMYDTADGESQEETEEVMGVFAGATGKIIGPKGSKIQEIKSASNVKDIKMPTRQDGLDRPRARDLVEITILGKPRAIRKAMELIQEVVDEWTNAPRPPRGAGGGSYQARQNDFSGGENGSSDVYSGVEATSGTSGDNTGGDGAGSWECAPASTGIENEAGGWGATGTSTEW